MFKSIDNNNSIPNNYIYTSNKGNEYMYLDGSWMNCKTLNIVESVHNFKMNRSAIRQIREHNEKNSLKIGKKYIINESEYTYVGRNSFSSEGNLLSENMNITVKKLFEAENSQFSNFSYPNPSEKSIPNKFFLTNGDYIYNKSTNTWYGPEGKVTDKKFSSELNADALKDIEKYNKQDRYPVNSTIQYNGKTYTYTGMNWVADDGTKMSDKFLYKVDDWLDQNPEIEKQSKKEPASNNVESPKSSSNSSINVGQRIKDKYGKEYKFDGTDFVDSTGTKLPSEQTAKIIQKNKDWQDAKANGTEDAYNKNNTTNLGSEKSKEPQNASQPKQSTDATTNSTSEVPNGYVYKSKKGNSYFKKNGTWFNSETKKPINSSSVPMLERSAQSEIDNFNASSPVKIGQEFKSAKGITYHYVGGNRFISDNGKLLPIDTAQKVLGKLQQNNSEPEQSTGNDNSSNDNVQQDNSTNAGNEPENNNSTDSTDSNGPIDNSLESIAKDIKSSPEARRIIVLLSRGDDLSLLAADILLSGKQKEVSQILNSLNNEE